MVMVFMISRLRRASALAALLVAAALLTVACQKVPLLAPSGSTITLTALATALPSNGTTRIIAQVIEPSGTPPHSGTLITFTTNLGTIQPPEAETDISGKVIVNFVAGTGSGTATITAISGGVSASGTNAIKIAIGASAVGAIALSASPTALSANGGTTTITATVTDSGGNALPGVPVTFSTDNGSLATSVVTSDSNGRATTTLTTSRTSKVTATAGVPNATTTPPTTAATNTITINVNAAATVSFSAATPSPASAGQPVSVTLTVTPSATGATIQNVVVNFGDGRSQTLGAISGATVLTHTYDSPGVYTLTATVVDSNGDQFTGVSSVSIGNRARPTIAVTAPDNATPGTSTKITLAATPSTTTSAPIQQIQIDFGDGQSQTLQGNATSVQHVYQKAGTYTITAVATDANSSSGSGSTVIVVGSGSNADFTFSPSTPKAPNASVSFSAATSSAPTPGATIVDYSWNFGNGQVASGSNPNQTTVYATASTYVVTLTVTDSAGGRASTTKQITVTN